MIGPGLTTRRGLGLPAQPQADTSGTLTFPKSLEDPKSRTPNSGSQYSYGIDYRTLRWIYISGWLYQYPYVYPYLYGSYSYIELSHESPKVDIRFGIRPGVCVMHISSSLN